MTIPRCLSPVEITEQQSLLNPFIQRSSFRVSFPPRKIWVAYNNGTCSLGQMSAEIFDDTWLCSFLPPGIAHSSDALASFLQVPTL
jgi:hypothetical protein